MTSSLFIGSIRHRHRGQRNHQFKYTTFMHYLDLDEIDTLFNSSWLWSTNSRALGRFDRRKHFGQADESLKKSVFNLIKQKTGQNTEKVYLLTNLTYFGYCCNPISLYFCFNKGVMTHCLLEVTNTPWGEKHLYLTQPENIKASVYQAAFKKEMHVSPFLEMNYEYRLRFKHTDQQIIVQLENWRDNKCDFDATLSLLSKPINKKNLSKILWRFPFITGKIYLAIRWQAFRLWLKGFLIFNHPRRKRFDT